MAINENQKEKHLTLIKYLIWKQFCVSPKIIVFKSLIVKVLNKLIYYNDDIKQNYFLFPVKESNYKNKF